jgi:hypothetical protein
MIWEDEKIANIEYNILKAHMSITDACKIHA